MKRDSFLSFSASEAKISLRAEIMCSSETLFLTGYGIIFSVIIISRKLLYSTSDH